MSDLTNQFAYLFRGRTDAYGLVHGESVHRPVDPLVWSNHLHGDTPIGIYPMVKTPAGMRVAWGCTDIDGAKDDPEAFGKTWPLARNMQKTLRLLGITSWIEMTKGRGYHVWVFVDGWASAEAMRNMLLLAHQVAGVTATEVNPKQLSLNKGAGLGNYVNLPYPNGYLGTARRVMTTQAEHGLLEDLTLDDFVSAAMASLNSPTHIAEVAAQYRPPPTPPRANVDAYTGDVDKTLTDKLGGLAWRIWNDGPLEGRDRSGTLMRLAHLMAEGDNMTPGEGLALLSDADARWGKFLERGEPEQLETMIARAWGKHLGDNNIER